MSTYFKVWNATISAPDPDRYVPEPEHTIAHLTVNTPVRGAVERGTVHWGTMTLAQFIDLWDRWDSSKNASGTFVIPGRTSGQSWTTWRSVTAYAEEPRCRYAGNQVHEVSMVLTIP